MVLAFGAWTGNRASPRRRDFDQFPLNLEWLVVTATGGREHRDLVSAPGHLAHGVGADDAVAIVEWRQRVRDRKQAQGRPVSQEPAAGPRGTAARPQHG